MVMEHLQLSHDISSPVTTVASMAIANMTPTAFKEILFYLLTLNCTSFMLRKPPFSLPSLLSSMLRKLSAAVEPSPEDMMISFHPQLFIAPYIYLYAKSDGAWRFGCAAIDRVCDSRKEQLCESADIMECVQSRGIQTGGLTDLLDQKEKTARLTERTRDRAIRKRNGKNVGNIWQQRLSVIRTTESGERHLHREKAKAREQKKQKQNEERAIMQRSKDWAIKIKYEAEKIAIQKTREEIIRKKYESQKVCHNEIKLLGRKFLEKSLQQGLQIQHKLAGADHALRSMPDNQSDPSDSPLSPHVSEADESSQNHIK